jgi:hypothetical protein
LLSEKVLHRQLRPHEKKKAGPIVHYAYGALAGGLYGAAAEVIPAVTKGEGTLYATALFVGGDEIAVPAPWAHEIPGRLSPFISYKCAGLASGVRTEHRTGAAGGAGDPLRGGNIAGINVTPPVQPTSNLFYLMLGSDRWSRCDST